MFVLLSVEIGYQLGINITLKSASVTVSGWLPFQQHMNVTCYCFQVWHLTICDMILTIFLFILLHSVAQVNMSILYIVWMAVNFMSTDFIIINKWTCLLFSHTSSFLGFLIPVTLRISMIYDLNTHSIRITNNILWFFKKIGDFSCNKSSCSLWFIR
jgi:hypothetical protein